MKMKQLKIIKKGKALWFMACLMIVCHPLSVFAMTEPTQNDFLYEVYNIVVNKMLKGPAGFVGGIAMIVVSAATVTKSWVVALLGIVGGTAMLKADTIVTSMGMLINSF